MSSLDMHMQTDNVHGAHALLNGDGSVELDNVADCRSRIAR